MFRFNFRRLGCLVLIATLTAVPLAAAAQHNNAPVNIKVMTRNVFQGTDFTPVMTATDFPTFLAGVDATWAEVEASKPAARMAEIAREVAAQEPDIVGLQEVTKWSLGPDCATVRYDLLAMLVNDLNAEGVPYTIVATVPQFQFAAPSMTYGCVATVTQSAIIARTDRIAEGMKFDNIQTALFPDEVTLKIPLLGSALPIARGWASADVTYKQKQFRFITTQTEAFAWQAEVAQTAWLLQNPANSTLPVVMAADFNTYANNQTDPTYLYGYSAIVGMGFSDAWLNSKNAKGDGETCCRILDDRQSKPADRIDLIFTRETYNSHIEVKNTRLSGNHFDDRTENVWPSDHAGLLAHLTIQ